MTATALRIKKEARALFWPWCAVMSVGALPLVPGIPHFLDVTTTNLDLAQLIGWLGFFGGIPLLASLPFGNEFECRTLSLLLSQPAGRMEIWREKLMVTAAAVVSAAVVCFLGWRSMLHEILGTDRLGPVQWVAGLYVITATASATFWTFSARSTLGGVMQGFSFPFGVVIMAWWVWPNLWDGELPPETIPILSIGGFGYAGVMLWLGRRKLERFQVTGGLPGDDLATTGPNLMPGALAGWFRCRPSQPFFNLIRKELRVQRPLWRFPRLLVLYMTCLAVLGLFRDLALPAPRPATQFWHEAFPEPGSFSIVAALLIPVLMSPWMAMLAGCLSMGEERTTGTLSWHMTLPVPARRQWLIKLLVAAFTGFVCAVLVPVLLYLALGLIFVLPRFPFGDLVDWWLVVPLLSFIAAFWCACAVSSTARATIWIFPVTILINLAAGYGDLLGQELAKITGTLRDFVVSCFQLNPLAFASIRFEGTTWPWLFVPVLLLAVIQSYRLFRTEPQESFLWMIRCLLPLASLAFLCGFLLSAGWVVTWQPFPETQEAIERLQAGGSTAQLTVEDLARVSPLSRYTRRWLRDSSISIAPDQARSGYLATIHLASGLDCKLAVSHHGGRSFNPEQASCAQKGP